MSETLDLQRKYSETLNQIEAKELAKAKQTARDKALYFILKEHASKLPFIVVIYKNSQTSVLMRYIGTGTKAYYLYENDGGNHQLIFTGYNDHNGGYMDERNNTLRELDKESADEIIRLMQMTIKKNEQKIICPENYFIFYYTFNRSVGGYDEPDIQRYQVIQGNTKEQAFSAFAKHIVLSTYDAASVSGFSVYLNSKWQEMFPLLNGKRIASRTVVPVSDTGTLSFEMAT